jgi:serine/threonine protein kinase
MTASPSPDDRVSIGTVLDGRYRIDGVLGSGGMGRVYRGEHTGIGRPVAIKVLHADLNRNREAAARFQREALASGRLDHQNIVGVSDFGVLDDGACFLVMEALEGESLGERLDREKRIPWRDALAILRGVLAGLRHAHDRGVVHRDIKPDNVFLARKDDELVVKILDFGIAKLVAGDGNDPAATRAGLTVGTPAYLSPEQAVGGEIKPASDIYSATILLFEMLTGRAPFEDKDPLAMLGAHVSRPPPALVDVRPELAVELPPGLEDMIQRGLQKAAADRIASAKDYIAWIDAITGTGPTATGSAPVIVPPTPTPPPGTLPPLSAITPNPNDMSMILAEAMRVTPMPGTVTLDPTVPSTPKSLRPYDTEVSVRAVSLAETPPVPTSWLKRGAIVLAVVVAIALVVGIVSLFVGGSDDKKHDPKEPPKEQKDPSKDPPKDPPKDSPKPKPIPGAKPAQPEPVTVPKDEVKLKALLYEFEKGKDCAARKLVVPQLVDLDDPAAIPALKAARNKIVGGGYFSRGEYANRCMFKELDDAIKHLSRNQPEPPKPPEKPKR